MEARGLAPRLVGGGALRPGSTTGCAVTFEQLVAGLTVAAALGAAGLGLLAHLCWLAVTDPGELLSIACMFARVVI